MSKQPSDLTEPKPGTMIVVTSDDTREPWRLARVRDVQDMPGKLKVHFYDRYNNTASPDKQVWKPAYYDTDDRKDIFTESPKSAWEPYHFVLDASEVIAADVGLTKSRNITAADLRRIG